MAVAVQLNLNPNAPILNANISILVTGNVVQLCLAKIKESASSEFGQQYGCTFNLDGISKEERDTLYENWVLANGFHALIRSLREALNESLFLLRMAEFKTFSGTFQELEIRTREIHRKVEKMHFPDLISALNSKLNNPIDFLLEWDSFNKLRNCLEHRAGIVSESDLDDGQDVLSFVFPSIEAFIIQDGIKRTLNIGQVIDTHDPNFKFSSSAPLEMNLTLIKKKRLYKIGEKVNISVQEFHDIALACNFFLNDLGGKLSQSAITLSAPDTIYSAPMLNSSS